MMLADLTRVLWARAAVEAVAGALDDKAFQDLLKCASKLQVRICTPANSVQPALSPPLCMRLPSWPDTKPVVPSVRTPSRAR